jgi:hypothetical protein
MAISDIVVSIPFHGVNGLRMITQSLLRHGCTTGQRTSVASGSGLLAFSLQRARRCRAEGSRTMKRGIATVPAPRAIRGAAKNLAVAAAIVTGLASPLLANPAISASALIIIPPATLPPPPPAATASAEPLAPALRESLPTELQVAHDREGTGLALYGVLTGRPESATGALLAIIAQTKAFDPAPVPQLVLADESGRQAQALFTATTHGAPVIGIAVVALGDSDGNVSVLYDNADAFPSSFPRLQQTLASSPAVEIGMSDNSVAEAGIASGGNFDTDRADANWDGVVAGLVKGGETPIDAGLAHLLADRLAKDTGETWRIVSPTALR